MYLEGTKKGKGREDHIKEWDRGAKCFFFFFLEDKTKNKE